MGTKPRYPDSVRIGHMNYAVSFVPPGMKDTVAGQQNTYYRTIKIASNTSGQYRAFVMLHEILHGCFFSSALSEAGLNDREEIVVDALAKSLCGVIRDNPKLMAALQKDLEE